MNIRALFFVLLVTILVITPVAADEWTLVWEDNFQRADLGNDWVVFRGNASIREGWLYLEGAGATVLTKKGFGRDVRLVFQAKADPDLPPCDLSVALASNLVHGYQYLLAFGGRGNQINQILGPGVRQIDEEPPFAIEHGKTYRMVAERVGDRITYTVDGHTILDAHSTEPVSGPGFDRVGFVTWTGMLVESVRIYQLSPDDIPEPSAEAFADAPFYRKNRQLYVSPGIDSSLLQPALDAFNEGSLTQAKELFASLEDRYLGLWGQAFVLGDLDFQESDRGGELRQLAEDFEFFAQQNPHRPEVQRMAEKASWFGQLRMNRDGKVSAIRLVSLGKGGLQGIDQSETNPFYHKARLYEARYLYWDGMEGGNRPMIDDGIRIIRSLREIWPDHIILRQYTGDPVPWGEDLIADTENHPDWAAYLREAYDRQVRIMEKWFAERQEPDGQLGGGWGDDVELLRTWKQIACITTGTREVADGIQRLVDGVWEHALKDGYEHGIGDVEHSAEPSADSLPTMLLLRYGDPLYFERNLISAHTIKNRFMGIDDMGHPRFRSVMIGADGVNTHPRSGGDTGYHARAMKHYIWLGWYGYPEASDWLIRWSEGWRQATMAHVDDKLPGLPPPTLWYPSGDIYPPVDDVPWWDPIYNYYGTPGLPGMILDSFLAAYYLGGSHDFLRTFQYVMDIGTRGPLPTGEHNPPSPEWHQLVAAHSIDSNKTALYKMLTGERVYDEYTRRFGNPAQVYRTNYELDRFKQSFQNAARSQRHNLELQTTEVLATDRAALSAALTVFGAYTGAVQGFRDAATPTFAVTYDTPDANFAALVIDSTPHRVRLWLYSFWDETTRVGIRPWRLIPGKYTIAHGQVLPGEHEGQYRYDWQPFESIDLKHRADTVYIDLPPGRQWVVDLRLDEPFDTPHVAPDLAIHHRDIHIVDEGVHITVHNIGGADAPEYTIALQTQGISGQWETIATKQAMALPAPQDFVPSKAQILISLDNSVTNRPMRVILDPENRIYEINPNNNTVVFE